jgi:MFS family permease
MTDYFRFVALHWRFLLFGVLAAALSGFGQTFYVGVFGGELRAAFDLTHGQYGLLYSLATLSSGILMVSAGAWIDRMSLQRFAVLVGVGVAAGALVTGLAASALMLGVGFFLLRLFGQGLFMHMASTSMGRHFEVNRGKAVSIASKGLPLAEAVMPAAGVALIALIGWRHTWLTSAVAMLVFFIPLLLWLLHGRGGARGEDMSAGTGSAHPAGVPASPRQWSRSEVLRDLRFYRLLPVVLAPPLIVTAMIFHLAHLGEGKGWSLHWLASTFTGFALAHVAGLLVSGVVLDRYGPRLMLRVFLLPMLIGLLVVAWLDHPLWAWVFMVCLGASIGGAGTLLGALWPVLYGVAHLGAIRAMVHSAMMISTAIMPVTVGLALDASATMESVALVLSGYIVVALVVSWGALNGSAGSNEGDR